METVSIKAMRPSRLQSRKILETDLLPEKDVLGQGFAGHTINDFPEPARSYNIAYARLAPVFQHTPTVPLLVRLGNDLIGVMNSVWSSKVGIVPIQRIGADLFEVSDERVTYLEGEDLNKISFALDEILSAPPAWCK